MKSFRKFFEDTKTDTQWWDSKSEKYKIRYISKHPNSKFVKDFMANVENPEEWKKKIADYQTEKDKSDSNEELENDSTEKETVDETIPANIFQKKIEIKDGVYQTDADTIRAIVDAGMNMSLFAHQTPEERISTIKDNIGKYEKYVSYYQENYDNSITTKQQKENGELLSDHKIMLDKQKRLLDTIENNKPYKIIEYPKNYGIASDEKSINNKTLPKERNSDYSEKVKSIAKKVSFKGLNEKAEKEIVNTLSDFEQRHPFMKDHFGIIASKESKDFKEWLKEYRTNSIKAQYLKQNKEKRDTARAKVESLKKIIDSTKIDMQNPKSNYERMIIEQYQSESSNASITDEELEKKAANSAKMFVERHKERSGSNQWACYRPTSKYSDSDNAAIVFSNKHLTQFSLDRSVEMKYHPEGCNTVKSIMDHELGHALWFKAGLNMIPVVKGEDGRSMYKHTKLQKYILEEMKKGKQYITDNLSQYAAVNQDEFFAEAYSEYINNPNPRPIAKQVGELYNEYAKEKFNG